MAHIPHDLTAAGGRTRRPGAVRVYRGSRKRLRQIKWQDHTPLELCVFTGVVLVILVTAFVWLTRHHHTGAFDVGPGPVRVTPRAP
jgi:hypothetical protein